MRTRLSLLLGTSLLLSTGALAAPAKPDIAWMPSTFAHGEDITVQWDLWWGANGTHWDLQANSQVVCEGSLTDNSPDAQGAQCTRDFSEGDYNMVVNLCNESGCTTSDSVSFVVNEGAGGDDGNGDDSNGGGDGNGNADAPASPTVGWLDDQVMSDGSADFTVGWNMWWGDNGDHWVLYQNGEPVHSASLTPESPSAQSGAYQVSVTETGTYDYVVSLCNDDLCTESDPRTVAVTSGAGNGDNGDPGDWDPWTDLDLGGYPHSLRENNRPYNNSSGNQVGAYFTEWGIYGRDYHADDIPAQNLTHLYYGFIPVCGPNEGLQMSNPEGYSALQSQCSDKQDYEVVVHDNFAALEKSHDGDEWDQPVRGLFAEMYRLKQTHPDLVILPSVGGWTLSDPLYDIGTDAEARAIFIESMIDFIRTYDFFDGIDIDWEFPGGGGVNPDLGGPEDAEGYVTLMRELREALDELSNETGRTYELASAMSGGVEKLSVIGDGWAEAVSYMDHLNLMTYDYYGAWSGVLGHMTGIYPAQDAAIDGFSAHEAVQYMLSKNVPPGKISLGVAKYGRGWTDVSGGHLDDPFSGSGGGAIDGSWQDGVEDYSVIEEEYLGGPDGDGINGFQLYWDDIAQASYLWNYQTGTLISFDTQRSVEAKGEYVLQNQLGGLFSWSLDSDNGHLLNSMHEGMGHPEITD